MKAEDLSQNLQRMLGVRRQMVDVGRALHKAQADCGRMRRELQRQVMDAVDGDSSN